MAFIKFKLANTATFSNNFASILLGKNGFQTTFGSIPLLANIVSVVNETADKPDGYLRFTVVGFDQLHDYNFNKHVLAVNDTAFQAASGFIKGFDFVTIPLEDKTTDISPENFVGALSTITELSYNIASYDVAQNFVEIVNEHSGAQTLSTTIPTPPFYVTFSQIIDKDHLKAATTSTTDGWRPNTATAGNVYVAGTTRTLILENNVIGFTGSKTLPLGTTIKNKNFIKFYVDGLLISDSDYSFTADSDSIIFDNYGDEKWRGFNLSNVSDETTFVISYWDFSNEKENQKSGFSQQRIDELEYMQNKLKKFRMNGIKP